MNLIENFPKSSELFYLSFCCIVFAYPLYCLAIFVLALVYFGYLTITCCGECGCRYGYGWFEKYACGCQSCIGLNKPGMLITSVFTGKGWSKFSGIEKDIIVPICFFLSVVFVIL